MKRGSMFALLWVGLPLFLAAMFLPDYALRMRDELEWRAHKDPFEYLDRWPSGAYELLALAEMDTVQRSIGLVARLVSSRYGPDFMVGSQVVKAVWDQTASQILTGSATIAIRWDAASGSQIATYGDLTRSAARDPLKWGFGFNEIAWFHDGASVLGMTSGPHSLWFFAPQTAIQSCLKAMATKR